MGTNPAKFKEMQTKEINNGRLTSIPAFEKPLPGEASTNWKIRDDHISGDAGFFGGKKLAMTNPAKFKEMQTKEINNGRLAMIGIAGMVAQELVTGAKLF